MHLFIVTYWKPDDEMDFVWTVAKDEFEARKMVMKEAKEDWGYELKEEDIKDCYVLDTVYSHSGEKSYRVGLTEVKS